MPHDQFFCLEVIKKIFKDLYKYISIEKIGLIDAEANISAQISLVYFRPIDQPVFKIPFGILILYNSLTDADINDDNGYFLFEPLYVEPNQISNLEYVNRCGETLYNNTLSLNIMRCLNKNVCGRSGLQLEAESKTGRIISDTFKEFDCSGFKKQINDPIDDICLYNGELNYLEYRQNKHCSKSDNTVDENIFRYIKLFIENSIFCNLPFQLFINIDADILSENSKLPISELHVLSILELIGSNNINLYKYVNNQHIFATISEETISSDLKKLASILKLYQKIFFIVTPTKCYFMPTDSLDPPFSTDDYKNIQSLLENSESLFNTNPNIKCDPNVYNIFISSPLSRSILLNAIISKYMYDKINTKQGKQIYSIDYNFDYIYNIQMKYFISYYITYIRKYIAEHRGKSTDYINYFFNHILQFKDKFNDIFEYSLDYTGTNLLSYVMSKISENDKKYYSTILTQESLFEVVHPPATVEDANKALQNAQTAKKYAEHILQTTDAPNKRNDLDVKLFLQFVEEATEFAGSYADNITAQYTQDTPEQQYAIDAKLAVNNAITNAGYINDTIRSKKVSTHSNEVLLQYVYDNENLANRSLEIANNEIISNKYDSAVFYFKLSTIYWYLTASFKYLQLANLNYKNSSVSGVLTLTPDENSGETLAGGSVMKKSLRKKYRIISNYAIPKYVMYNKIKKTTKNINIEKNTTKRTYKNK